MNTVNPRNEARSLL